MTDLPEKDLTVLQKKDFLNKIVNLDTEAHNLIFVLIKCYYMENDNGDYMTIPYNGILAKDRIDFDLLTLPNKLRQLLYKFVNLHGKKMAEDKEIEDIHTLNF